MSQEALRIKVCGITRSEDALLSASLGAWALGFIFARESPRYIAPEAAGRIVACLADAPVKTVGVFVNADLAEIRAALSTSGVNTVQLHGDETLEFCQKLRAEFPSLGIVRAFRPRSREDLADLRGYSACADQLLIDAFAAGQRGGTGIVADWELARKAKLYGKILLSGGLSPENISAAWEQVQPYGVDVSSGLELSPGIKSAEKIRLFFENARQRRQP